jgi:hypothetical protein
MANITVTVQSLLSTALYDSYTIDNAQTVAQLKTAINTAKSFNSTWYDLVAGNVLTESSTLASLGIVTGTQLRTHNKIARLGTRQARQEAKLALATLDRTASSKTYTLTINDLPTKYSGNTLIDNPNTGGLVTGRPWTAVASIRALLSGSGQTAYDAASSDAFFAVSSTDYDAVVAGVASVSTVGPTDAEFASTAGSPFSATYIVTYPQAAATVPASNYILGFRATTAYANQQWRIYGGPTFKSTSPVYSQISTTSPSTGAGAPGIGTFYYLRKAPAAQAATTYIGIYGTQTLVMTAAGTFTGGGYTNAPFTAWSNWTTVMPKVQVIITPTAVV